MDWNNVAIRGVALKTLKGSSFHTYGYVKKVDGKDYFLLKSFKRKGVSFLELYVYTLPLSRSVHSE